jgi:TolB protein
MVKTAAALLGIHAALVGGALAAAQRERRQDTLAFTHTERAGFHSIYLLDITSGLQWRATHTQAQEPFWSASGEQLVFVQGNDLYTREVAVLDVFTGGLRLLTQNDLRDDEPSWSPDGKQIAFITQYGSGVEIAVVSAGCDGLPGGCAANMRRLTFSEELLKSAPRWSPDGRRIVYTAFNVEAGSVSIYTMNQDGSSPKPLLDASARSGHAIWDNLPAWSPDGKQIAFQSNRDSDTFQNFDIYTINADGSNLRRLTRSRGFDGMAAWSPDGRYIAFGSNRSGNSELYIMDADGNHQRRLTYQEGYDGQPAWRPN